MNVLTKEQQVAILRKLTRGGMTLRAVSEDVGVARNTCTSLLFRFGNACQKFLDREMRDLELRHLQCDELWSFVRKKEYRLTGTEPDFSRIGDFYIYVALDAETRLVPAHLVGRRDSNTTQLFMDDLASRIKRKRYNGMDEKAFEDELRKGRYKPSTRISSDSYRPYTKAVEAAFGAEAEHGRLKKRETSKAERAETGKYIEVTKTVDYGDFDEADISTSLVERQNLTLRRFGSRLQRRTNSFSKKVENLVAAMALHFVFYNYGWEVATLKKTPAVAAGVAKKTFSWSELFDVVRECSPTTLPVRKG